MEVINLIINKSGNILNYIKDDKVGLINHLLKQEEVVLIKVSIEDDELEKLLSFLTDITDRKLQLLRVMELQWK